MFVPFVDSKEQHLYVATITSSLANVLSRTFTFLAPTSLNKLAFRPIWKFTAKPAQKGKSL